MPAQADAAAGAAQLSSGQVRAGISGWVYPEWRGAFYPKGLVQRRELEFASSALPTIEINGTFYSLQRPESFQRWHDETPDDFVFSVKAPKFITQVKRLRDVDAPLANFFASGIANLKTKLGPILWQLPPWAQFEPDVLAAFLAQLPHDTDAAAALAQQHDAHVEGHAQTAFGKKRPLRHALEVRHESFVVPEFIALLRRHGVAMVIADTAGKWPEFEDITADFVYLRLHGATALYASGYSDAQLQQWAARIDRWRHGDEPAMPRRISDAPPPGRSQRDVFCYFDNTMKVFAPRNARRLLDLLGEPAPAAFM